MLNLGNMNTLDLVQAFSSYRKKDLYYYFYQWSKYKEGDPKVSGPLDKTPFKRYEGREVLYFINCCALEIWNWPIPKDTFRKLEKALRYVPSEVYKQVEVKQWILDNHLKFWASL